jgi:hypothetical protein
MTGPKYTRHQVPRGTRPDAEANNRMYLIKSASVLRATYQIRLLLYMAEKTRKKLVLRVRKDCRLAPDLAELRGEHSNTLLIEKM